MDIITSNDCGLQFGQLRPLTEFDRFGRTFATGRSERQVLALSGILMWERAARFSCWQGLPDRHLLRCRLRRPSGLRLPRRSAARQLRKLGADRSAGYRPCRLQKPEIPQLILSIERPGEPRRALAASGRLSAVLVAGFCAVSAIEVDDIERSDYRIDDQRAARLTVSKCISLRSYASFNSTFYQDGLSGARATGVSRSQGCCAALQRH